MTTLVLAGLVLLQAASPAGSGQWILWQRDVQTTTGGKPTNSEPLWNPLDGFADVKECRLRGDRELKMLKIFFEGLRYFVVLEKEREVLFEKGKAEEMVTVRYVCFPALFDPRR